MFVLAVLTGVGGDRRVKFRCVDEPFLFPTREQSIAQINVEFFLGLG